MVESELHTVSHAVGGVALTDRNPDLHSAHHDVNILDPGHSPQGGGSVSLSLSVFLDLALSLSMSLVVPFETAQVLLFKPGLWIIEVRGRGVLL